MSIKESRLKDTGIRLSTAIAADYVVLLKPRVMALAIFTAFVGMAVAPEAVAPGYALAAVTAIAAGAGGAGALNMWFDADIDAVMSRTARRPIPMGRVVRGEALVLGLSLSALSVTALGMLANWLAGLLLAFTIFFYVVVYTMWLKRATPQNIVIGGAAGALPPMIGWAAATGSIGIEAMILFLVIFLWTPPHFWALALFKKSDYAAAGIPMMPNIAGPASTKRQMLVYALLLAPVAVLPWLVGFASMAYGLVAIALGAGFVWHTRQVLVLSPEARSMRAAKALFAYSILYLFVIFAALLADTIIARTFFAAAGNPAV
jgi:protoheme IX farnesyltransferase